MRGFAIVQVIVGTFVGAARPHTPCRGKHPPDPRMARFLSGKVVKDWWVAGELGVSRVEVLAAITSPNAKLRIAIYSQHCTVSDLMRQLG